VRNVLLAVMLRAPAGRIASPALHDAADLIDARNPADAARDATSSLRRLPVGLEISGLRFRFDRLRLVGQELLHPLVEVFGGDGLRFAGREFACHLGLRLVAQGTDLRGGIVGLCAFLHQNTTVRSGLIFR
jgi:hypothetical protein